ncbi:MAG: DUF2188 domain-containing protein [Candidatus Eremiobacteraeota bacterium]|nr:DUF2188 domain-containing protein [Candidatus Eremiobacteraeota bacterium]
MTQAKSMHVTPHEEGWALQASTRKSPVSLHQTQKEAIRAGHRAVHQAGGGELLVHARSGEIRDKITVAPGHDPYPPKG